MDRLPVRYELVVVRCGDARELPAWWTGTSWENKDGFFDDDVIVVAWRRQPPNNYLNTNL